MLTLASSSPWLFPSGFLLDSVDGLDHLGIGAQLRIDLLVFTERLDLMAELLSLVVDLSLLIDLSNGRPVERSCQLGATPPWTASRVLTRSQASHRLQHRRHHPPVRPSPPLRP